MRPGPRLLPVFALSFTLMFALHAPLLRLPYFWDEAGHFVPAARDLLLTGDPIPTSTLSNGHPPLLAAFLALWWKLGAYTPASTRIAMLLVAALALTGLFRLARRVASLEVAAATTLVTALYPVFFAQSTLVHLDMAAAAFTLWGLSFYVEERRWPALAMFSLAALAKETAIVAPFALLLWELARPRVARRWPALDSAPARRAFLLLLPALPLALWFAYHAHRTGYVFGNPEFVRYNVSATLDPLRILLAGLRRAWHLAGYMHLWLLTGAMLLALRRPTLRDGDQERPRIAWGVQAVFAVVILAYGAMASVLGGAVLARYLLPVTPLVILLCVSTLRRRVRGWGWVVAVVAAGFVAGLMTNPPYPFPPEDNLTYRDYVLLHKRAADLVAARYPQARVLTAWPATDELTKPYLGYTRAPLTVVPVEDFSAAALAAAARPPQAGYDVALLFSTKYQPPVDLFDLFPFWEQLQERYFDYHRDLSADDAARMLGGRLVWREQRRGEWVAVVELERKPATESQRHRENQ